MGDWAELSIGKKHVLYSKYEIPFCWSILFEPRKGKSILRSNVANIKSNLAERGITFDGLERHISLLGHDQKLLKKMRDFLLDETTDIHKLVKKGYNENSVDKSKIGTDFKKEYLNKVEGVDVTKYDTGDDEFDEEFDEFLGIFDIIDFQLEYYPDSAELVSLYELLILLELSEPGDSVVLDLEDLEEDSIHVFEDAKQNFVNVGLAHEYLFTHSVDEESKMVVTIKRIDKITNEDVLIDKILLPLLRKMGFENTVRIPYHGPNEMGVDIGPLYDSDRFGNKIFYGAQIKSVKIHNNSTVKRGNIGLICGQIENALQSKFTCENNQVYLNKIFLITSKTVTEDAKNFAYRKFKDRIQIFDQNDISRNLIRYHVKFSL